MPRFTAKTETWATTDLFVPAVISEADFRRVVVDGVMGFFFCQGWKRMSGQTITCMSLHTHFYSTDLRDSCCPPFRLHPWLLL